MAGYREFHVEPIYAPPDVSILAEGLMRGAENTSRGIGDLFRAISENQIAKRKAADQYKFDLGEGKFETDDNIFYQKGINITQRGKEEIRTTGHPSLELEKDQQIALQEKRQSDWQFKKFEQNEKDIALREKEDNYFDPTPDRQANRLAAYGEDNDIYFSTRGERLEAYDKIKGRMPQSLKGKVYTADYVKTFGKKEKTKSIGDPNFESTTYDATPFLTPQGTPGVTIDHAKEYLNSRPDGSVARWIENLVDQSMDADVKYNKDRNPELKGLSDDEVKLYLKANPSKNEFNKKDFASRVIEKAQSELTDAASMARNTDYETKVDKSLTGGLYNNDNIGHSYVEHMDTIGGGNNISDRVNEATGLNKNYMPGGNLRIGKGTKIGAAIPVELNPQYSYNIRSGKSNENRGSTAFNLTGYQLQPYKTDGSPYNLAAKTPEELIQKINNIPLSEFKNLESEMKIGLRGYTIEYGNKLGEIAAKKSDLDDELGAAIKSGNVEEQARVNQQIAQLDALKGMMNLSRGEFSDDDMLSAFKQNGIPISNIKRDLLLQASKSDLQLVNKNLTQGLNLGDKNKWSDPMRAASDAYNKRARQAAEANYQDDRPSMEKFDEFLKQKPKKAEEKTQGAVPTISSDEEYNKLPSGSEFIAPDGLTYRKP